MVKIISSRKNSCDNETRWIWSNSDPKINKFKQHESYWVADELLRTENAFWSRYWQGRALQTSQWSNLHWYIMADEGRIVNGKLEGIGTLAYDNGERY